MLFSYMEAKHVGHLTPKMPGLAAVVTVRGDINHAMGCVEQLHSATVAADGTRGGERPETSGSMVTRPRLYADNPVSNKEVVIGPSPS
jgi:hypothetical protein